MHTEILPSRRRLLLGLGAVALVPLASCRSVLPEVDTGSASQSASGHVAALRGAQGLSALVPDSLLEDAARQQAGYMAFAGKMDHTAMRGRDFVSRMKASKVPAPAAENLAHGRMDLDRLFQMWMDSDGHRRNMLDPRFSRYGLAWAADQDGRRYWALVLSA